MEANLEECDGILGSEECGYVKCGCTETREIYINGKIVVCAKCGKFTKPYRKSNIDLANDFTLSAEDEEYLYSLQAK